MRTLNLLSSVVLAVASFTLPAAAADLPVKARPMAVAAVYNWTGCYIGGNVGGKWARTTDDVSVPATAGSPAAVTSFASATSTTLIGGGQAGCNYQAPGSNWVFGLEGDVDWQRWSITRTQNVNFAPFVAGDTFDISSKWQGSARGRIGYAWDRWMLYATGGAAFTGVRVASNFPIFVQGATTFPATFGEASQTLVGPTVGGGFEYAFANNWSFGVEGRYSWYGTRTFNTGLVAAAAVITPGAPTTFLFAPVTQTVKLETAEIMAKLNFKLF